MVETPARRRGSEGTLVSITIYLGALEVDPGQTSGLVQLSACTQQQYCIHLQRRHPSATSHLHHDYDTPKIPNPANHQ